MQNDFKKFLKAYQVFMTTEVEKTTRETKKQVSIVLTPTDRKKIQKIADDAGMSISELISIWINLISD